MLDKFFKLSEKGKLYIEEIINNEKFKNIYFTNNIL